MRRTACRFHAVLLACLGWSPGPVDAAVPPPGAVDFNRDVAPVLEQSCVSCHGRGRTQGDLSLATRADWVAPRAGGAIAVAGQGASSRVIRLVSGSNPDLVMPRKGRRLTPAEVDTLRRWIDAGLPWPAGRDFSRPFPANLAPPRAELPPGPAAHPIDRFLPVPPAARIGDRQFQRRAMLDLVGLLPEPAEVEAFLADPAPDRRERWVRRLLDDRQRYADHWLTLWNDLLRNDERGTGFIDGGRRSISVWLRGALVRNLPADQLVSGLLTPAPGAGGFLQGIAWRGDAAGVQSPPMQAAQGVAQVFLGVNLKCAACHDSLVSDWTLADAYGFAAVFAEQPLEQYLCDRPTGRRVAPRFLFPQVGTLSTNAAIALRREEVVRLIIGAARGRLARTLVNRIWDRMMGRGLVEPLDDLDQPSKHQALLDWLAADLIEHQWDLQRTMERIATSGIYQSPAVDAGDTPAGAGLTGPRKRLMSAEQFCDAIGRLTGIWADFPVTTFGFGDPSGDGEGSSIREPRWLWNRERASVAADIGAVYFRRELVLPEIPDSALAVVAGDDALALHVNGAVALRVNERRQPRFVDIRPRLRVGTNVLGVFVANQAEPPGGQSGGPAGWVFHARLRGPGGEAELVSDQTWTAHVGPSPGWQSPGFADPRWTPARELGNLDMAPWHLGEALRRACSVALVHRRVRSALTPADDLMTALGRPSRDLSVTRRPEATSMLRALELVNGPRLADWLQRGAGKLLAESGPAAGDLPETLFRRALGRSPTESERRRSQDHLDAVPGPDGVADLMWSLVLLPEFQLVP